MPFYTIKYENLNIKSGFLLLSHADCDACNLMKQCFELLDRKGRTSCERHTDSVRK